MSSVVFGSRDAFRPRSATPTAAELGCIAAKALAFEEYCEYTAKLGEYLEARFSQSF